MVLLCCCRQVMGVWKPGKWNRAAVWAQTRLWARTNLQVLARTGKTKLCYLMEEMVSRNALFLLLGEKCRGASKGWCREGEKSWRAGLWLMLQTVMVELGIDHSKQTSTHICSSTRALPNLQTPFPEHHHCRWKVCGFWWLPLVCPKLAIPLGRFWRMDWQKILIFPSLPAAVACSITTATWQKINVMQFSLMFS